MHSFYFVIEKCDKMKCLYFDGTGFWLLYKRLEKGRFKWNVSEDEKVAILDKQQFNWLLEGLKTTQKTAFKKSSPKFV